MIKGLVDPNYIYVICGCRRFRSRQETLYMMVVNILLSLQNCRIFQRNVSSAQFISESMRNRCKWIEVVLMRFKYKKAMQ
jgi:hypothetical protein